jgi:hypothetical protein
MSNPSLQETPMDPRIRLSRALLAVLLLPCSSFGWGPPVDPVRSQDEPRPIREGVEAGLKKRRALVLEAEESAQWLRGEVKLFLSDAVAGQHAVVLKAKKEFENAKLARETAAYHDKEYTEGIYLQDKATALGRIVIAREDLERAEDRRKELGEKEKQGIANPNEVIASQFGLDAARLGLEQVQIALQVLELYTKDKEIKKRETAVAAAQAFASEKEQLLKAEEVKEERLRVQAEWLKVRAPEDVVLAFIDDAIEGETKVVGLIADAKRIESEIRDKPAEAETLMKSLSAKRAEAGVLMNRAKSQLVNATMLAEQVTTLRT